MQLITMIILEETTQEVKAMITLTKIITIITVMIKALMEDTTKLRHRIIQLLQII